MNHQRNGKKQSHEKKNMDVSLFWTFVIRDAASLTGRSIMHKDNSDPPHFTTGLGEWMIIMLFHWEENDRVPRLYLAQTIPPQFEYHELLSQTNKNASQTSKQALFFPALPSHPNQ
jgi:hypothetical protein